MKTGKDLIAEAVRLQPLLMEHSERNEELNALAPEVVEAIHEAGFVGMWVPKDLGGPELSPRESIELVAALAYADPATSWVTMAAALSTGTGGAYLHEDAPETVFGGKDRFPIIAGQGTRTGTVHEVEGGYSLTGDWSFGSGIRHADFIHTAAADPDTGKAYIFVLPVKEEYLDASSWDVMGLIGTGSIDYKLRDVFVPKAFGYDMFTETALRGGGIFRIGTIQFALLGHTGFAIGVGRRLLDELAKLAQAGKGRPGQLASDGAFLEEYGRMEARLRLVHAGVAGDRGEPRRRRLRGDDAAEDARAPRAQQHDVRGVRRDELRHQDGGDADHPSRSAQPLHPGHDGRLDARHVLAAGAARLRSRARRPRAERALGVPRPRPRPGLALVPTPPARSSGAGGVVAPRRSGTGGRMVGCRPNSSTSCGTARWRTRTGSSTAGCPAMRSPSADAGWRRSRRSRSPGAR